MTDVKAAPTRLANPTAAPALRRDIALLFFAYRDFTADPDAILARDGLGRAHHRALHFIGRHPDIPVTALLGILRITKQSLARVLKRLLAQGLVLQRAGPRDRRQRLLALTDKGAALDRRLTATQRRRLGRAFEAAGPAAVEGYRQVLVHMIDESRREEVLSLLATE